ncbi:permease-like cell division protein FtsX [Halosquirtibacter laminarini]|uniref:Permease-like cell division protein FtsX n=1 Tax=Halosquirtibacter laminarini TaxID=3374600 RepID=A0AC61NP15_9BACT|nr:permease-like cell division protein FtsX [Prolixibacteraceae bacterium]
MGKGRQNNKRFRSYISVIFSHQLILFLIGFIMVVYFNAREASKEVYEGIGMSLLISDDISDEVLKEAVLEWKETKQIRQANIISREKAAESIKKIFGEDAFDVIGYNPMQRMVDISLEASFAKEGDINMLRSFLEGFSFVQQIFYKEELLETIRRNLKSLYIISLIVATIFIIVFISLMRVVTKNSMQAQKGVIKNMRLVGASNRFIRKPFLEEACWVGFIGATLALITLVAFVAIMKNFLYPSLISGDLEDRVFLSFIIYCLGIGLTWITTRLQLYSYMKENENQEIF